VSEQANEDQDQEAGGEWPDGSGETSEGGDAGNPNPDLTSSRLRKRKSHAKSPIIVEICVFRYSRIIIILVLLRYLETNLNLIS
jgi:hypothetical protein